MVVRASTRLLVLGVALVTSVVLTGRVPVTGMSDPPAVPLHPALGRLLDQANGPVAAWVFFGDKGFHSEAAYAQAIERVASTYNTRAVKRRALRRTAPGLFDDRDIPVSDVYVDAVERSGARLRVRSRWLNAASVNATREQLEAIAGLPFVTSVEPVRRTSRLEARPAVAASAASAVEGSAAGTGSFYGRSEDQLSLINLIALHEAGYTGAGVVIGV